jgi:hypothetical protein
MSGFAQTHVFADPTGLLVSRYHAALAQWKKGKGPAAPFSVRFLGGLAAFTLLAACAITQNRRLPPFSSRCSPPSVRKRPVRLIGVLTFGLRTGVFFDINDITSEAQLAFTSRLPSVLG